MKKYLCYLVIFLLIIVILTPPLLRVFYKETDEEVVEKPKDVYAMLECRKEPYYIATSYKNNNPLNIKFERLQDDLNLEVLSDEYELEFILDNALKNMISGNIEETDGISRISYYVEYKDIVEDTLLPLSDYRLSLNEQKNMYETKGYVCNIIE